MKTSLVILAAGLGSRFGGSIKQIEPVGSSGELIMDYSIFDALGAGFDKVVFIIRRDIEQDFRRIIGDRISRLCEVEYVYQDIDDLPCETAVCGRTKPWGTTHALWCCRNAVHEPFLIINADDYYGKTAFKTAHDFMLSDEPKPDKIALGMVGFVLKNTLSENGSVTRGICTVSADGMLTGVEETYNIVKYEDGAAEKLGNDRFRILNPDACVSMNMWCMTPEIFSEAERQLKMFLSSLAPEDIKPEHVLPMLVNAAVNDSHAAVHVSLSHDQWVGVTYREDKPLVVKHIKKLTEEGYYPVPLAR